MLPCACRALPLVLRAVFLVFCLCILALQLTFSLWWQVSLLSFIYFAGIGSFAFAFAPLLA